MTTKIEWVRNPDGTKGETWNPCTGCSKVSAGCKFCFAERMARRLAGRHGYPPAPHHFDVTLRPDRLEQPLRWKKSRRIFVCSMGDLFHKDVPFDFVDLVFLTMTACGSLHTFQVLTKRPGRMLEYFNSRQYYSSPQYHAHSLPNVWLGVTVENQATADERIPQLLQTPAAVRFVSCEPLLGAVNIVDQPWWDWRYTYDYYKIAYPNAGPPLDWVIVGGESGPGARPMHPDWARLLRDQCQAADIPYFFKSWGAWSPYNKEAHEGKLVVWQDRPDWGLTQQDKIRFLHISGSCDPSYKETSTMIRIGKRAAGRLLDGRTWDEFPKET